MYNRLNKQNILRLYENDDLLISNAWKFRADFYKNNIELCSIVNIKSGNCSENCKFCSQSIFHRTKINKYEMMDIKNILQIAKKMESYGVKKFSLVTSGKSLSDNDLNKLIPIYKKIKEKTNLSICASHGLLGIEKAKILKECGVTTYHHNVETSEKYFKNICTTHSYKERINTIINAKKAGLKICSGGILGMGESEKDRIDMACELQQLEIKSIPINILLPIKGTILENEPLMTPDNIIKSIALFMNINQDALIRLAGGRQLLNNNLDYAAKIGISGLMIGDYLTTSGSNIQNDLKIITEKGFNIV